MSSVEAARQRLKELEKAAHAAAEAVKKADKAAYALQERQDKRRRREWDMDSEEEEDEDGDGDDDDDKMSDAEARKEKTEEFADEEAEDFDFEAKQERLEQETNRCKIRATEAYNTFVTEFEKCVKADVKGPLEQLYEKIHTKLPIELREMIYSHLGVRAKTHYNDPTKRFPIYVGRGGHDPDFQSWEGGKIDDDFDDARRVFEAGTFEYFEPGGWLLNPEYVGRAMARGIAEYFYAVNDFSLGARELENFLLADRSQTGLKPYEYIRNNLSIGVTTTRCNGGSERAWKTTENEAEFLNRVYRNLSHLMLITHKSALSVDVTLSTSAPLWEEPEVGERRFYNIMESVRAPIYDLIHAGVKTKINHNPTAGGKTKCISEEPLNYFRLSKEEWAAEKENHGPDWIPSKNFITREAMEDRDKTRREATRSLLKELLEQRWGHTESIDAY